MASLFVHLNRALHSLRGVRTDLSFNSPALRDNTATAVRGCELGQLFLTDANNLSAARAALLGELFDCFFEIDAFDDCQCHEPGEDCARGVDAGTGGGVCD